MLQQTVALIIILFFIVRLFVLKKADKISAGEFVFWLFFWIMAGVSVLALKWVDKLVAFFGFSASGINFLTYIAILILFYFLFRLRLKMEKMDKNITEITRRVALNKEQKE